MSKQTPTPSDPSSALPDAMSGESGRLLIERIEEEARFLKTEREVGTVRIESRTVTEDVTIEDVVSSRTAEVTRVAIDRELAAGDPVPQTRQEGEVTIIPVLEERLVTERRLVLREEIHVRVTVQTEPVSATVPVRKQVVTVTPSKTS